MDRIADIIFYGGEVITVNQDNQICTAIAVEKNEIIYVGSIKDALEFKGSETTMINLYGRSLLPGFIDSHIHMFDPGLSDLCIDCSKPEIKCINDILELVKAMTQKVPNGEWIRGLYFDENKLEENRILTLQELDEIAPDHPVQIWRRCGHLAVLNSRALNISKTLGNSLQKWQQEVEHIEGTPTGKVIQETANDIWAAAPFTRDELLQGLINTDRLIIQNGITSVHDAGGYGAIQNRIVKDALDEGKVRTREYAMIYLTGDHMAYQDAMIEAGAFTGLGDEWFRLGPIKVGFVDGSSSAPSAAVSEPYLHDKNYYGEISISQELLNERVVLAHKSGFQVTAHAIGDRAIDMYLTALEEAVKKVPVADLRHRIEHSVVTTPELLQRMKNLNLIVVVQPNFIYYNGDIYHNYYGEERVLRMFQLRTMLDMGIRVACSSDCPVFEPIPLLGIHTAVNRKSKSGNDFSKNESISILEAIRMYTINGAYASFEESRKGSLEVGKIADFVIISSSILNCDPEDIIELSVDMTVINGKIVYDNSQVE